MVQIRQCWMLTINHFVPLLLQGFGFVNFEAPEQAAAAVQDLNGRSRHTLNIS
jgi:hypothetical protein